MTLDGTNAMIKGGLTPQNSNPDRARLEAVGLMTAGIVHDLGNMTQIVSSAVNILRHHSSVRDVAALQPVVAGALSALERSSVMIGMIVGFGRSGSDHEEVFDVAGCLAGLERMFQWAVSDHVRLRLTVPPGGLHVCCNRRAFENAVLNLIINSSDAMPDGGTVSIDATQARDESGAAVVRVRIADTGEGMPPEVLARAFDPFFTTKPEGRGTGLGLGMVRGFAEGAGGSVTARSRPNLGTTISLHLPVAASSRASELHSQEQGLT